jgi:hypothetical protein
VRALCSLWAYEALEASGALDSLSDTRRRAVVVGLRFMALIVCFAGLLFTLEALGDIAGLNDIFIDAEMGSISFYQMCYFIFVTISTVGYGDFAPKTVLGRAFVGVVITGGVAFFSVETSALVNLAATEASGRGAFKKRRRGRHVLVAGGAVAAGGTTLTEFLDEMCAPGHGAGARGVPHCVVATPREPSPALRELLRRPGLRRHVTFLAASLLDAADLGRCRAADAAGAFVLADLGAADPVGEDEEAVLAAVALHRACPRVPLTLLVNGRAAVALATAAGLPDGCCVAADALAPALLALAARAPGAATLAANLLRTAPPAPPRQQHRPWHDEYLHGLSAGMHGARLGAGAAAAAKTFGRLAAEAHAQHNVTLLAMSAPAGALQVNPEDSLPLRLGCIVWGIGASAASRCNPRHAHPLAPPSPAADSPAALTRAVSRGADDEEEAELDDWREVYHAGRAAARAARESERGARAQSDDPVSRWGAAVAGAARRARADVDSHALSATAVMLATEEDEAGDFSDLAAVNAVAEAGGHVVIINSGGDAWARCEGVVTPLRRVFLPASPALVLLSPAPPPRGLLRRHGRLLAVRGTAQDAEAMLRAGVDTAARVVYLAGGPMPDGGGDDDGSGGGGALDRRAVLSTNILERHHEDWQRDVFLTVELRAPASVKYLQEAVPQPQREAAAAAAAAGAGAEPSSARSRGPLGALELRELRELRALLSKGFLSGQGALNALLGTELALLGPDGGLLAEALPPVRASAVLHARFAAGRAFFASDACRAVAAEHYAPGALAVLAALADPGERAAQALWLAPLPGAQVGRTYGALFTELRASGVTPLGLYRQPEAHLELPFVFAAPPPWMLLQREDAAYVLAPPAWAAANIDEYLSAVRIRAVSRIQSAWRRRRAAAAKQ